MKLKIFLLTAVLSIVVLITGIACTEGTIGGASTPQPADTLKLLSSLGLNQQAGIWVNGEGKITIEPDIALIQLGVDIEAPTVTEAQAKAAMAMDKIKASLNSNGVADKDIKTTAYNIQPVYQWTEKGQRAELIAYKVTNMATVKIREVKKAGIIIDAVALAGGDSTRINSISFTIDDPTPYYKQAREKAVNDGIAKAEQIAELTGVELGAPRYVTESGGYIRTDLQYAVKVSAEAPAPTTTISPGELDITLTVQMVFTIE